VYVCMVFVCSLDSCFVSGLPCDAGDTDIPTHNAGLDSGSSSAAEAPPQKITDADANRPLPALILGSDPCPGRRLGLILCLPP
jgi:hypothetical protein